MLEKGKPYIFDIPGILRYEPYCRIIFFLKHQPSLETLSSWILIMQIPIQRKRGKNKKEREEREKC